MPLTQDIYDTLVKDPDLDIGEHQTREEAAQTEADFRARQYVNNIRALSLATEPLEKVSPIKALLQHVSSISKTIVSGSISIAQNILKISKMSSTTENCSICMDEILPKCNCTITKCKHMFHTDCLLQWIVSNPKHSCPFCRYELVKKNEVVNKEVNLDEITEFINSEYTLEDPVAFIRDNYDSEKSDDSDDDSDDDSNDDPYLSSDDSYG